MMIAKSSTQTFIEEIVRRNSAGGKGVLELWLEGIQSDNTDLLDWFSQNRHMFERLFLMEPQTKEFSDKFLLYHFGIERPNVAPIIVCAMPKSGSTSFTKIVGAYLGRQIVEGHNKNSQAHALDIDILRGAISKSAVIHTHLLPSADVLCLIAALRATPIVLFRNILDAIESRCRSEANASHSSTFRIPVDLESCMYRFTFEYISFAYQWKIVCERNEWPILNFEDNVLDWVNALRQAVLSVNLPFSEKRGAELVGVYNARASVRPADFRISTGRRCSIPTYFEEYAIRVAQRFGRGEVTGDLKTLVTIRE